VPDLPGDIWIWTGWPLFDIKVVQFEFNQLGYYVALGKFFDLKLIDSGSLSTKKLSVLKQDF